MEQHMIVCNDTLLRKHTYHSITPSRKWLSTLYSTYNQWKKFIPAAVVLPPRHPKTTWLHHVCNGFLKFEASWSISFQDFRTWGFHNCFSSCLTVNLFPGWLQGVNPDSYAGSNEYDPQSDAYAYFLLIN